MIRLRLPPLIERHRQSRDWYMAKAREAKRAARDGQNGVIQFYQPVEYYIEMARHYNRMLVENLIWRKMR